MPYYKCVLKLMQGCKGSGKPRNFLILAKVMENLEKFQIEEKNF